MEKNKIIMKYIICDASPANWGKTTTLLEVVRLFESKSSLYTIVASKTMSGGDEWRVVRVNSSGKIIIVQTQGDEVSSFKYTEDYLKKHEIHVDIIICASRSSGASYQKVLDIANTYHYKRILFSNFCPQDRKLYANPVISDVNKVNFAPIIINFALAL